MKVKVINYADNCTKETEINNVTEITVDKAYIFISYIKNDVKEYEAYLMDNIRVCIKAA